ncbi:MAG: hypothetical protein LBJ42_02620 [Holosporales bacterium]|jgi:3-deoxy-D-manno-octulosonic-acid transferase|nr:hypothetical protein [Holosporales bacterium]
MFRYLGEILGCVITAALTLSAAVWAGIRINPKLAFKTAGAICRPIVILYTRLRVSNGLECKIRRFERFGISSTARPPGKLVWIHAVSVGEMLSIIPFISKLHDIDNEANILLTTTTVTAARMVEERLGKTVIHQFAPFDIPMWVKRFIRHWTPNVVFFVESDLWPNTLYHLHDSGIPTYLLNARCSRKSLKRLYVAKKAFGVEPFGVFSGVYVSSLDMLTHVKNLGANAAYIMPSLKMVAEKLPVNQGAVEIIRRVIGTRKVWIAVSSHPGEEEVALDVHKKLKETLDVMTIIAVRHPHRAGEVTELCNANGLTCALHSSISDGEENVDEDIYIVDQLGCLGAFFQLVDTVLVCGSLIPGVGGHNFLEPIRFGCNVATGKYFENFTDVYWYVERACAVATSSHEIYEFVMRSFNNCNYLSREREASINSRISETEKWADEWEKVIRVILG